MEACNFSLLIFFIFTFMVVLDGRLTCPHLHFPFKVDSFCKHNQPMIRFPGYGDLVVKSIAYDHKKLTLIDPKDCVFEVFLNLNLDPTPFRYYHVVKNYTYWNCSVSLSPSFEAVPCLSGSGHHVYVEESGVGVPSSCELVKTVLIPFAYSSYVSDDSFGLDLTWDSTGFQDFAQDKGWWVGLHSIGEEISLIILVFMIVGLACVKINCSKKSQNEKNEHENLLGDLETL